MSPTVEPGSPPEAPPAGQGLPRLAVRGALYAGASQYFLFAAGLVKTAILARLVPPELFGLVALATVWVSYLTIFRFDLRTVIVSDKDLKPVTLWVQFVLDNALVAIGFLPAAAIQIIWPSLGAPELWFAIYILLGSRLFDTLSSTPQYLLEKQLRQDIFARLTILGALLGMGLAVGLAWQGRFLAALLADAVVPLVVTGAGAWIAVGWRPQLVWDTQVARNILSYGSTLWTTSLLGKIIFEFDDWLVGSITRVRPLDFLSSGLRAEGFYSRAYNTAKMPMDVFAGMIGRMGLSLYAEGEARGREVLLATYRRTTWLLARLIFFSTAAFIAAEEITLLLLGPTWLPMVPLFRLMFLFVVGRPFFQNTSQLLLATRKEKEMRRTVGVQAVIMLLAGPPAVLYFGAAGAAVVVSGMMVVGLVASEWYVIQLLGAPIWRTYVLPAAVSVLVVLVFWALGPALAAYHPVVSLAIKGLACGAAFVSAALLAERREAEAVFATIREHARP